MIPCSKSFLGAGLCLLVCLGVAGCWRNTPGSEYRLRSDMVNQPSYKHNEEPRRAVEGTVTTTGIVTLQPDSLYELAMEKMKFTGASLDTARVLFGVYCSPCHGVKALGDGPVAAKFQQPPNLTAGKFLGLTDAYIYGVIRNGIRIMPSQREMTSPRDRWLIIAHLRSLQRQ